MSNQPPNNPKFPVCRKLFDDENNVETLEEDEEIERARLDNFHNRFLEGLRESREAAQEKWNFDFENEKPLEGDWEWEKVGESSITSNDEKHEDEVGRKNQEDQLKNN